MLIKKSFLEKLSNRQWRSFWCWLSHHRVSMTMLKCLRKVIHLFVDSAFFSKCSFIFLLISPRMPLNDSYASWSCFCSNQPHFGYDVILNEIFEFSMQDESLSSKSCITHILTLFICPLTLSFLLIYSFIYPSHHRPQCHKQQTITIKKAYVYSLTKKPTPLSNWFKDIQFERSRIHLGSRSQQQQGSGKKTRRTFHLQKLADQARSR